MAQSPSLSRRQVRRSRRPPRHCRPGAKGRVTGLVVTGPRRLCPSSSFPLLSAQTWGTLGTRSTKGRHGPRRPLGARVDTRAGVEKGAVSKGETTPVGGKDVPLGAPWVRPALGFLCGLWGLGPNGRRNREGAAGSRGRRRGASKPRYDRRPDTLGSCGPVTLGRRRRRLRPWSRGLGSRTARQVSPRLLTLGAAGVRVWRDETGTECRRLGRVPAASPAVGGGGAEKVKGKERHLSFSDGPTSHSVSGARPFKAQRGGGRWGGGE